MNPRYCQVSLEQRIEPPRILRSKGEGFKTLCDLEK